jgi:hypothetical protein
MEPVSGVRGQGHGGWGGEAEAEAFVHVEEAQGLPEGAQGEVEGVVVDAVW